MNALTDEATINALYDASQAGVQDRLDRTWRVRIAPRRQGLVGQHSRALDRRPFARAPPHLLLSRTAARRSVSYRSADWMGRNLFRRIEIAWPVLDPKLRKRVVDEGLTPYLEDTQDAWMLQADGEYRPPQVQPAAPLARSTRLLDNWQQAREARNRHGTYSLAPRRGRAGEPDLDRKLTAKGEKQARRVAEWLQTRLPQTCKNLREPCATRAADCCIRWPKSRITSCSTLEALAPGASAAEVLAAHRLAKVKAAIVVVGHQPTLGLVASRLLSVSATALVAQERRASGG